MSDILTGPDRGPPKFDWREKAMQLEQELKDSRAHVHSLIQVGTVLASVWHEESAEAMHWRALTAKHQN